jgi:hypothetical protein
MPAKDFYHETVKTALIKDGWTVADKSLTFMVGKRPAMIDLAAEKFLIAERNTQKIAVEVKSFLSPSPMNDLEKAIGQFFLYFDIMAEQDPDRKLYLAVPQTTYNGIFSEAVGELLLRRRPEFNLVVFDPNLEEITQWKH